MVASFTYDAIPGRVVFGPGSRGRLGAELDALGATRALLVAGEYETAIADELTDALGEPADGPLADVAQHVPIAKAAAL